MSDQLRRFDAMHTQTHTHTHTHTHTEGSTQPGLRLKGKKGPSPPQRAQSSVQMLTTRRASSGTDTLAVHSLRPPSACSIQSALRTEDSPAVALALWRCSRPPQGAQSSAYTRPQHKTAQQRAVAPAPSPSLHRHTRGGVSSTAQVGIVWSTEDALINAVSPSDRPASLFFSRGLLVNLVLF